MVIISPIKRTYIHFKLEYKVYIYYKLNKKQTDYFSSEEIQKLAVSKVDDKILNLYLGTI